MTIANRPRRVPIRAVRNTFFLAASCLLLPFSAVADDSGAWRQDLLIYLLAPTIEGTAGIGPTNLDVDVDAESVFDNLDGAFLAMYAAERNDWGVFVDAVYMDLEADIAGPGGLVAGKAGNKQLTVAASATRRFSESWQALGGVMYTDIDVSLATAGPIGNRSAGRSESWWDPFVGLRFSSDLGQNWGVGGFAYVGGFGVGSDLMWSANLGAEYRFSDRNALTFMYRYISFDYEDGNGIDRFRFDIAEHGPALGWHFRF